MTNRVCRTFFLISTIVVSAGGQGRGGENEMKANAAVINDHLQALAAHAGMTLAVARKLVNAGYLTAVVPEYNDEQRFIAANGSYGALASAYAWTETTPNTGDFNKAYQNVGMVY